VNSEAPLPDAVKNLLQNQISAKQDEVNKLTDTVGQLKNHIEFRDDELEKVHGILQDLKKENMSWRRRDEEKQRMLMELLYLRTLHTEFMEKQKKLRSEEQRVAKLKAEDEIHKWEAEMAKMEEERASINAQLEALLEELASVKSGAPSLIRDKVFNLVATVKKQLHKHDQKVNEVMEERQKTFLTSMVHDAADEISKVIDIEKDVQKSLSYTEEIEIMQRETAADFVPPPPPKTVLSGSGGPPGMEEIFESVARKHQDAAEKKMFEELEKEKEKESPKHKAEDDGVPATESVTEEAKVQESEELSQEAAQLKRENTMLNMEVKNLEHKNKTLQNMLRERNTKLALLDEQSRLAQKMALQDLKESAAEQEDASPVGGQEVEELEPDSDAEPMKGGQQAARAAGGARKAKGRSAALSKARAVSTVAKTEAESKIDSGETKKHKKAVRKKAPQNSAASTLEDIEDPEEVHEDEDNTGDKASHGGELQKKGTRKATQLKGLARSKTAGVRMVRNSKPKPGRPGKGELPEEDGAAVSDTDNSRPVSQPLNKVAEEAEETSANDDEGFKDEQEAADFETDAEADVSIADEDATSDEEDLDAAPDEPDMEDDLTDESDMADDESNEDDSLLDVAPDQPDIPDEVGAEPPVVDEQDILDAVPEEMPEMSPDAFADLETPDQVMAEARAPLDEEKVLEETMHQLEADPSQAMQTADEHVAKAEQEVKEVTEALEKNSGHLDHAEEEKLKFKQQMAAARQKMWRSVSTAEVQCISCIAHMMDTERLHAKIAKLVDNLQGFGEKFAAVARERQEWRQREKEWRKREKEWRMRIVVAKTQLLRQSTINTSIAEGAHSNKAFAALMDSQSVCLADASVALEHVDSKRFKEEVPPADEPEAILTDAPHEAQSKGAASSDDRDQPAPEAAALKHVVASSKVQVGHAVPDLPLLHSAGSLHAAEVYCVVDAQPISTAIAPR
ncbi:hypothetical protein CYMTET_36432, partial [Cymbomonas tetramitiformis]